MDSIVLHFHGPLTFTPGERSLFHSSFATASCVYLWTFRSNIDGLHYIHYIGEAKSFAARQKEHLIHILGMNYGIFDPAQAYNGIQARLWAGLWRDRSPDGVGRLLERYSSATNDVLRYVHALTVFVAATDVDIKVRKHIEGSIGWNLRHNYTDKQALYPDDNHTGIGSKMGVQLLMSSDEAIAGIDPLLEI